MSDEAISFVLAVVFLTVLVAWVPALDGLQRAGRRIHAALIASLAELSEPRTPGNRDERRDQDVG